MSVRWSLGDCESVAFLQHKAADIFYYGIKFGSSEGEKT